MRKQHTHETLFQHSHAKNIKRFPSPALISQWEEKWSSKLWKAWQLKGSLYINDWKHTEMQSEWRIAHIHLQGPKNHLHDSQTLQNISTHHAERTLYTGKHQRFTRHLNWGQLLSLSQPLWSLTVWGLWVFKRHFTFTHVKTTANADKTSKHICVVHLCYRFHVIWSQISCNVNAILQNQTTCMKTRKTKGKVTRPFTLTQ